MWCFINHTQRHIVATDLYDIGRRLRYLINTSGWSLGDDIDVEDIEPKAKKYQDYTFDL